MRAQVMPVKAHALLEAITLLEVDLEAMEVASDASTPRAVLHRSTRISLSIEKLARTLPKLTTPNALDRSHALSVTPLLTGRKHARRLESERRNERRRRKTRNDRLRRPRRREKRIGRSEPNQKRQNGSRCVLERRRPENERLARKQRASEWRRRKLQSQHPPRRLVSARGQILTAMPPPKPPLILRLLENLMRSPQRRATRAPRLSNRIDHTISRQGQNIKHLILPL
jgi:hypothetical protein